jgi:uncharacterized membrane protein
VIEILRVIMMRITLLGNDRYKKLLALCSDIVTFFVRRPFPALSHR